MTFSPEMVADVMFEPECYAFIIGVSMVYIYQTVVLPSSRLNQRSTSIAGRTQTMCNRSQT